MRKSTTLNMFGVNIYWLGLSFMWNSLHVLMMPALMLNYVADEQKNTALGLLTFFGLIIAMIVQPISGAISDRWASRFGRRRPFILLGTAFDLIFLAILALAGGIPALAIGYIGLQFTSNTAHGPAQGLMKDLIPTEKMGIASGVKNFFDMGGTVVSSLLIARILDPESPLLAFAVVAGMLVFSAIATLLMSREESSADQAPAARIGNPLDAFRVDLREHRNYALLIGSRLLFLIGIYGVQSFAQYFLRDTLQAEDPVKLTGDLMATIVLTLIAFSILAGFLSDRFGRKPMHVVAAILVAAGSLGLSTVTTSAGVLGFGSIIGSGIGIFLSVNWALANDLAPAVDAGKFLGLTNLATAGAAALARLIGPLLDVVNNAWPGEYHGYTVLFITTAVLSLGSLIVLRRIPDPSRR
jgi:MFS family permease